MSTATRNTNVSQTYPRYKDQIWTWFKQFECPICGRIAFQRHTCRHIGRQIWNVQSRSNDGQLGDIGKYIQLAKAFDESKQRANARKTKSYDIASKAGNILFPSHDAEGDAEEEYAYILVPHNTAKGYQMLKDMSLKLL
eukprot:652607_1